MNLSEKQTYRFGNVEVDTRAGNLKYGTEERHLRPKTFEVLVYLLERNGQLVTKDELMQSVWKDTAVTDDALVHCVREIRRAIGDDSQQPQFIKTIPKLGYRFISQVTSEGCLPGVVHTEEITRIELEFEEDLAGGAPSNEPETPKTVSSRPKISVAGAGFQFRSFRRFWLIFVILGLISALSIALYFKQHSSVQTAEVVLPPPGRTPIAVMFFENQSATKELDWLRGGLADMLITSLSRFENLAVLNRQQLYLSLQRSKRDSTGDNQLEDVFNVARQMKVDFVVSGSFAQVGEKIRIDVRINNPSRKEIIASESLVVDQPDQILEQVDLMAAKLARRLGISNIEQAKEQKLSAVMTSNLEAYRHYSLAVEQAQAYHSLEAIELLKKAIALDPEFAMAYARIGYTYAVVHNNEGQAAKPYLEKAFQLSHRLTEKDHLWIITWYALAHEDLERARRTLRQIITQFPLEVEAYFRLGSLLGETNLEEKFSVLKQGLAVDQTAHDIWNLLGFAYCHTGRYEEAFAAFRRYIELAPGEANAYDSLGMCYNEAGRFDEALIVFKKALDLNPRFHLTRIHVGDSYLHQGRYRAALEQYRHGLEVAPSNWDRAFAYNKIATVYLKKGDLQQAEEASWNELRLKNDLGGSFLVALRAGRLDTAQRLKTSFLENSPEFRPLSGSAKYRAYFLGQYALKLGRADEAIEYFKQLSKSPNQIWNDRWTDCLAQAYLELERWDDAAGEYERLIDLNPNFALLHYNLGKAYEQKGQRARARAVYERFLQIWKDADADIPEVIAAKQATGKS